MPRSGIAAGSQYFCGIGISRRRRRKAHGAMKIVSFHKKERERERWKTQRARIDDFHSNRDHATE